MTEQNRNRIDDEAAEAIKVLKECKKTGNKVKISDNAFDTIDINYNTRVAEWGRDNLPIRYNLHRKHGVWLLVETHTGQKGRERTIHYITAGKISVEHEELDLDAARETLENAEYWTADIDQTIDAIETRQKAISEWCLDGLISGSLAVIGSEDRLHFTTPTTTVKYHDAPELTRNEEEILRDALSATHPIVGDYVVGYQHPHHVEFTVEVNWDTAALNPEEFVATC